MKADRYGYGHPREVPSQGAGSRQEVDNLG